VKNFLKEIFQSVIYVGNSPPITKHIMSVERKEEIGLFIMSSLPGNTIPYPLSF
jgi:hypothetical protein